MVDVDKKRSLDLLMDLLKLDGIPGEEREVSDFIENRAIKAGVKKGWIVRDSAHKRSPYNGETGNLIITLPGTVKAPRIMFSAHIDKVELAHGSVPIIRGNYIYPKDKTALGGDNRGGTAVLLNALVTIMEKKLSYHPLTFLFTVQEELGALGARYVAKSKLKKPSCCYNFDGGSPEMIILRAPSCARFTTTVKGQAAHAGIVPQKGVSAALIFAEALSRVNEKNFFGEIKRKGKRVGTSNIGVVEGGTASNVVIDELVVKGQARSYSDRFLNKIVNTYKASFENAAQSVKNDKGETGSIVFEVDHAYYSFNLPKHAPAVKQLTNMLNILGLKPWFPTLYAGLDANWINAHGIPTVTLGAGNSNPHSLEEKLDIDQFFNACRIPLMLATVEDGI